MVDKNRIRLQCNQIRIDLEKKNWFIDPITDFYRGLDHVYLRLATFLIIGQSGLIAFSTYSFEKLTFYSFDICDSVSKASEWGQGEVFRRNHLIRLAESTKT